MRQLSILFLCVVCLLSSREVNGASPGFIWTNTATGGDADVAYDVAVYTNNYFFVAGYFRSTNLTFGSITVSNTVRTVGAPNDCFLALFNSNGVVQWAKSFGGTGDDRAFCAATDAQGNCYIAGSFGSTNFSIGGITLTNTTRNGSTAFFVAKVSKHGQPIWARCPDQNFRSSAIGLAVDPSNNVYVTGSITGMNIIGGTNFVADTTSDVLLLKYDSAGNLIWGDHPGGSGDLNGNDLAVDELGSIYLSATFQGTNASFGSVVLTSPTNFANYSVVAIAKYDTTGTVLWAKQFGGELYQSARGIAVDAQHNCYITGEYYGPHFAIGSFVLTNNSNADIFVAKLGPDGTPLWAKSAHGEDDDLAWKIVVDPSGNSYIGGSFQSDSLTIDGTTLTNFSANGSNDADAFVAKFDPDGNLRWISSVRAEGDQRFLSLGLNGDFLYATGWTMGNNVYPEYTGVPEARLDMFVTRLEIDFPRLQCALTNDNGSNVLNLSWTTNAMPRVLEFSTDLQHWDILNVVDANGPTNRTVPADGTGFFRLQRF